MFFDLLVRCDVVLVVEQKAAAAGSVANTATPLSSMQHVVDPINALQNLAKKGLGMQQGG